MRGVSIVVSCKLSLLQQAGVTSSSSLSSSYMPPCEPATSYYCLTATKHPLTADAPAAAAFTGKILDLVELSCHCVIIVIISIFNVAQITGLSLGPQEYGRREHIYYGLHTVSPVPWPSEMGLKQDLDWLGPFHGAIVVPSVTRCRCRRCGHRCAGGVRQYSGDTWWIGVRRLVVANGPNIFQMLLVNRMHFFAESGFGWFNMYSNPDLFNGISPWSVHPFLQSLPIWPTQTDRQTVLQDTG